MDPNETLRRHARVDHRMKGLAVRRIRAANVSRELRALGYSVSPSERMHRYEGTFVRQRSEHEVSVPVYLDGRNIARTLANDIADSLREKGYGLRHLDDPEGIQILYVSRPEEERKA